MKKHKRKKKEMLNVSFLGINSAGLSSKLHSFDKLLSDISPGVFFVQETKMRRIGNIKTLNVKKYQVFELVRKSKGCGGLALGALHTLNPTWLGEGNDEIECLSIEITVQKLKIRCVVGYGPQEGDKNERKEKFWNHLDLEVAAAENQGTGFILQMDGNLWAGTQLIPGDPHDQNQNGKMFQMFLERNPHLSVVNSLPECEGLITRFRKTVNNLELSVLDFFIICDKVRPFLVKMMIDEKRINCLTNFNPAKRGKKVKESDHNPLIMDLSLKVCEMKSERQEMFNFKNLENQENFFNLTNETRKLTDCFKNDKSFPHQTNNWWKTLQSCFQQSFKKIRVTETKVKETEISRLLGNRKVLKVRISNGEEDLEKELETLECTIAEVSAEENRRKVIENFKEIGESQDSMNTNGVWNIKKKVFPKINQVKPTGKKNRTGQIITNPEALKGLYLETYKHRLRHRPMREDLEELKGLKEELFKLRLTAAKLTKSKRWNLNQLDVVLAGLKKNKARDPLGIVNELFKPGVIGLDLKKSLLQLLNGIRDNCFIPNFTAWANISSLYKGKGDKMNLENDRGIFLVTVFRSILMRMIYNDKYQVIDGNMSDSNVGARKGKNIRNHIFVINGIITDILNTKGKAVDIQILDYKQCFDAMWLEETLNDLYEAGVQDDQLAILYEANKTVDVSVKTPHGLTKREAIQKIILQGDVFGPIECSVTVDTYGKEALAEDKHLYVYKGCVKVPPLAMIDDLITVTECGYKSTMANSYLNSKTAIKKSSIW